MGTRHVGTPGMVTDADALPGRTETIRVPDAHEVLGHPLLPPFPDGYEQIVVGMGCFWGAERRFWAQPGVWTTAVGYAGGITRNPLYEEVCTGLTGHAEVVLAVFDPAVTPYARLLEVFWEGHDPTEGVRQGTAGGPPSRAAIYGRGARPRRIAAGSRDLFQWALDAAGARPITTEITEAGPFYYAEAYHQQYLYRNPGGYCGLGGTGVTCPAGIAGLA